MTKEQVRPEADQEKVARFVWEVEQWRTGDGITEDEWAIIEERAARRDLASDVLLLLPQEQTFLGKSPTAA